MPAVTRPSRITLSSATCHGGAGGHRRDVAGAACPGRSPAVSRPSWRGRGGCSRSVGLRPAAVARPGSDQVPGHRLGRRGVLRCRAAPAPAPPRAGAPRLRAVRGRRLHLTCRPALLRAAPLAGTARPVARCRPPRRAAVLRARRLSVAGPAATAGHPGPGGGPPAVGRPAAPPPGGAARAGSRASGAWRAAPGTGALPGGRRSALVLVLVSAPGRCRGPPPRCRSSAAPGWPHPVRARHPVRAGGSASPTGGQLQTWLGHAPGRLRLQG